MIKLYRHALSGHSHRVELFLSLLNLNYELVDVDLLNGEQKSGKFLKLNPFGQVPVIDDDGVIISDSNGILVYLASKYGNGEWLPSDPQLLAEVQRWLSVAAGPIAFGPAAARLITVFGADFNATEVIARAHDLLKQMDSELNGRQFLLYGPATIADVAAYAYIAHAPEGNVSLQAYANVRAWIGRIEALPGFVAMEATKIGIAA